jgi:archaemetzincin
MRCKLGVVGMGMSFVLLVPCALAVENRYGRQYAGVEERLRHLAMPVPHPGPHDWLANHKEEGQTFKQYLAADPVRKGRDGNVIYVVLLGEFTQEQTSILEATEKYLEVFYQVPVKIYKKMTLAEVPQRGKRQHPLFGEQILTTYVLDEVLKPERPKGALAYLAFTASDLFPEPSWNFVFGQASLRDRTGVWSIARFGDPAENKEAFQRCLRRMLRTASHETGHILTIQHCTAFACNMNGSNNLDEGDRRPLTMCPICLRKICWNLQVDPPVYLSRLEAFCGEHELTREAEWYKQAIEALADK